MLDRAAAAVRQCEARLRALIAEASTAGDYDAVDRLTLWARTLAGLQSSTPSSSVGWAVPTTPSPPATSASPPRAALSAANTAKRAAKQDYPRFTRQRNDLVKTGWSKKDKQEYQHRAPWPVVEVLANRLNSHRGKVFTTEDVFPLSNADGSDIPSYQAYLCLAWFRFERLVVQDGRQGYYVSPDTDVLAAASVRWQLITDSRSA